jgi:hypothetical protein
LSQAGYRGLSALPAGTLLFPNQPLDTSLGQAGYRGLSAVPGTTLNLSQPLDTSLSQENYRGFSAVPAGAILYLGQPLDTSLILSQADYRLLANLYISCEEITQELFNQDQLIEILEAV